MKMEKKNESSHSSIDHLDLAKPEKEITLEKIVFGIFIAALVGIGYCNHINKEKAKPADYNINLSTGTYSNTRSYPTEYKK
jgi:hypothetical protein